VITDVIVARALLERPAPPLSGPPGTDTSAGEPAGP
jgi:hypothetical protein